MILLDVAKNAIFFGVMFVSYIGFGLLLGVGEDFVSSTKNILTSSGIMDVSYGIWLTLKNLLAQGVFVIISLLTFLNFVSSFVSRTTIGSYFLSAIAGLFITPLVLYFVSLVWDYYKVFGIGLEYLNMVFINNIGNILLMNLVFGLLSFVFVRRQ